MSVHWMLLARLLLLLLLLALTRHVVGDGYPLSQQDFVVRLDDDNFEHETQASTGQTTGSWLVWAHRRRDDTPIVGNMPDQDFWAEHHVVVGALDVSRNSDLTKSRFQIRQTPALLYIHKGKVYRYPKAPDYPFSWDTITRFVTQDYALVDAEDVPPPRTWLQEATEFVFTVWEQGEHYFTLLAKAFGILLLAAVVNQLFFVDRSTHQSQTPPKAKQN